MPSRIDRAPIRARGPLSVKSGARTPPAGISTCTVLFADLRGYTGVAERLRPAQIVPLLDEFFSVLAAATVANGGIVYYMAGDGMMAGFSSNDANRAGALEALAAGHAMLQSFGAVAARWRDELSIDTGIGVGLHAGEVAMGVLGPPGRKMATLVGDTVNVAARLCGRARAGEVLLSYSVAAALDLALERDEPASAPDERKLYVGPIPVLHLPQFLLRGRAAPLDIWCVPAVERVAF